MTEKKLKSFKGRGFHTRHIYPSLERGQPRKTRPYITEILLMGHKESNQTNKSFKAVKLKHNNNVFIILSRYIFH